jgi:hypothetical protein
MATCFFIASGSDFPVDEYLRRSPLKACSIFRKGTIPPMYNPKQIQRPDSGFVVVVGDDSEPGVLSQLGVAFDFLTRNDKELRHLRQVGVDNMLLDFTVMRNHTVDQAAYFPPELIQAMASLGMGMITSTVLVTTD